MTDERTGPEMGHDDDERRGTYAERTWTPAQRASLRALGLTLAIVVAPFLALLFGLTAALAVLTIALGATAWLSWQASAPVGAASRGRLRALAALNGALALLCLVVVLVQAM